MYVTNLNFAQVLDRFYNQDKYDLMMLFVSSFDGSDVEILRRIVDNAKRIDRITGDRICFFYFIKEWFDSMNESITKWIKEWAPLDGEGVNVTMETADDICNHFGLLRSSLPAFILISKNPSNEPQLYSIQAYNDLEAFLTPLNILNSFLEDKSRILSEYNSNIQHKLYLQKEETIRNERQHAWRITLQRLERKKTKELQLRMIEKAHERDIEIQKYKSLLEQDRLLVTPNKYEAIVYPNAELERIRTISINRLNVSLNFRNGEHLIDLLEEKYNYSYVIFQIWDLVRTRSVRISRVLEKIRNEISYRGYDVFVSCKSQDYALAYDLYVYLESNGFKTFLADMSIKDIGIDQYTALIGEVIDICSHMIVFTTKVEYLRTTYVYAEWNKFANDINSGRKPNGKLLNIISPDIDVHSLPSWLSDKQCLTTENYKDDLLCFL